MRCSHVVTAESPRNRSAARNAEIRRVLKGVGSLFAIAERTDGDGPQPISVPADQQLERLGVAGRVGAQQIDIGWFIDAHGSHTIDRRDYCVWTETSLMPKRNEFARLEYLPPGGSEVTQTST